MIVHKVPVSDATRSTPDTHVPHSLSLVMPMAGRGSRFAGVEALPKPLIELGGKPFFWWAVESVKRLGIVDEMVFVNRRGPNVAFRCRRR